MGFNSAFKGLTVLTKYSFQENLKNLHYTCLTHYIHDAVYILTGLLPLHLPFLQVQENILLLSSNIPPISVNSSCPDMSSPLLRYNENIHHAHCSISHRFLEKYLGDTLEKGSSKTQCSLIHNRTTVSFPQVRCSCQLCYLLESLLLKAGNHSTSSFCCH